MLFINFCSLLFARNSIAFFKQFYSNADKKCYVDLLQKENTMAFDLQAEQKVFILNVKFSDTESYQLEDNIYDYMVIDSSNVFSLACVNTQQNQCISGTGWTKDGIE